MDVFKNLGAGSHARDQIYMYKRLVHLRFLVKNQGRKKENSYLCVVKLAIFLMRFASFYNRFNTN